METPNKREAGFTLIETIAVILLVGIISAVIGLAIVQGVKGYVFARQNVAVSQKAQLALARMERELKAITQIDTTSSAGNCIRYKRQTASTYFRAIGLHAGGIQMNAAAAADAPCPSPADPGNLLLDNIASFSIRYEDEGQNLAPTPPTLLENLRAVHISLTVSRADSGRAENFSIVVAPRNNGLLNAPGSSG